MSDIRIESPQDSRLDDLTGRLAALAPGLEVEVDWPAEQLAVCAQYGVFRWFIPVQWGGQEWSTADIVRGYLKLSAACLTTSFIITQYTGACRRLAGCENRALQASLLPKLAEGKLFATVGVSHLTTSRRHLKRPVLRASPCENGFVLDGMAPWVTGAPAADVVVVGATLDDDRQILVAVPTELPGVHVPEPAKLVGLGASQTGPLELDGCVVGDEFLVAGPVKEVMKLGIGAATGGLQTSTLATGLAMAAVDYLSSESQQRQDLSEATQALVKDVHELRDDVLRTADGESVCSNEILRTRANSLALRSTQAALAAAKGTGYILGHPAGRWCREALFFLVWSCPQPVMAANLCELAGITD